MSEEEELDSKSRDSPVDKSSSAADPCGLEGVRRENCEVLDDEFIDLVMIVSMADSFC